MIRVPYFPHPHHRSQESVPYLGYVPCLSPQPAQLVATIVRGDGSQRDPFVVRGGHSGDYVAVEYRTLERIYGLRDRDWTFLGQRLVGQFEHAYDVLTIRRRDGTEIEVWFDITEPFGQIIRASGQASPGTTNLPARATAVLDMTPRQHPVVYAGAALALLAVGYVIGRL